MTKLGYARARVSTGDQNIDLQQGPAWCQQSVIEQAVFELQNSFPTASLFPVEGFQYPGKERQWSRDGPGVFS